MPGSSDKSSAITNLSARLRTLAPAGNFVSPRRVFSLIGSWRKRNPSYSELTPLDALRGTLASRLSAKQIILTGSGTTALYHLLRTLREQQQCQTVAMAEFTCPEIAAAAVRAGLRILVAPVNAQTMNGRWAALSEAPNAIILSNLYGLAEELPSVAGAIIIDDACQSVMTRTADGIIGNRGGHFGILSFGRGKAICGIGGGAIIDPQGALAGLVETKPAPNIVESCLGMLRHCASAVAEYPYLYSIPASLPFLGLGETHYNPNFPIRELGRLPAFVALAQLSYLSTLLSVFRTNSERWQRLLAGLPIAQPFVTHSINSGTIPTRYPVILPSVTARRQALKDLSRFGVSQSYAGTLFDFAELRPSLSSAGLTEASDDGRKLANQLITLPVHRYVTDYDAEMVAQRLKEIVVKG